MWLSNALFKTVMLSHPPDKESVMLLGFLPLPLEVTGLKTPGRINETVANPVRSVSSVTILLNASFMTVTDMRTLLFKQSNQQGRKKAKKEIG